MSLKQWFQERRDKQPNKKLDANGMDRLSDEKMKALWHQCYSCNEKTPVKDFKANLSVCPHCGYHNRIGARERIAILSDRFVEQDAQMAPGDPLDFSDTQAYQQRQEDARKKAKLNDAVVTGFAQIGEEWAGLAVMDFAYMGGSMGSVVGEKITRVIETALEKQLPVIVITSSGGARMQEGMFSLMQMVKTSAALARLHEAGLFYLTILTEPTFGGVTASYGTLGDIIMAEQGARIGFAGRRVIEQTIRQKLPSDFQTANYLMKYGQVDMVTPRTEMKAQVEQLLKIHRESSAQDPRIPSEWASVSKSDASREMVGV